MLLLLSVLLAAGPFLSLLWQLLRDKSSHASELSENGSEPG